MFKRCIFLSVILLILFNTSANTQVEWSDPILISNGISPDFDIDRNTGHLHIVSMLNGVIYTETDVEGTILFQESVAGAENDIGGFTFGATIAVDNEGIPHVCFREPNNNLTFSIYYLNKYSGDWGDPLRLSITLYRGYMVRMAIDGLNRAHIAWGQGVGDIWGPVTYRRIENGRINMRQEDIAGPDQYRADDRLEIDASQEGLVRLIIGCPNPNNGPITYYRSTTADGPLQSMGDIHAAVCTGRNGSPDIFVDQAGNVHMCYGSQVDFNIGGVPSIRYVRYEGDTQIRHLTATQLGWLQPWKDGNGWGLGSVAASADGKYVAIAYLTKDEADLYVIFSNDGGASWQAPELLASSVGGFEGRSKHILRALQNNFYILYPSNGEIKLRTLMKVGDLPPAASAGGPYTAEEGTPVIADGSGSTDEGPDTGIVEYAWDWNNDGVFDDIITDSPQAEHIYTDDFQGQIVLRVKDSGGQTGYDTTTVLITNVPPDVDAGGDKTGGEGDTILFSAQVADPGSDNHTYLWNFEPGFTGQDAAENYIFKDDGVYEVIITVTDDDGGTDRDTLTITVDNLPPVADAGGPYMSPVAESLTLTGSAEDPGVNDNLTFQWDLDADGLFEVEGQETARTYTDTGTYMIWLRVIDDDGGVDVDTGLVRIMADTPVISEIPDQTINEGENFTPIVLDLYVTDPYQSDDQLVWQFYGNNELFVTLENRILTTAAPDSEWTGQEMVSLIVTDPKGFQDTTFVTFTVQPVNDPPEWISLPNYTFEEDDTLQIPLSSLLPLVNDVDDDPNDLWFWITGNEFIQWGIDSLNDALDLFAPTDWFGQEELTFVVLDSSGYSDEIATQITVTGIPDPPYPFLLNYPLYASYTDWPDSLFFDWHSTSDPDPGSFIYYEWTMRIQGGSSTTKKRTANVQDTTFTFFPDDELDRGTYLWWVKAYDESGHYRKTENLGIIIIRIISDVDDMLEITPLEFNLLPNYPNPFNSTTKITYHLPENSQVRLAIYNSLGQEVHLLYEGLMEAGIHTTAWNGRNQAGMHVPTGVYLCRMVAGSHVFLRKMMLVQ